MSIILSYPMWYCIVVGTVACLSVITNFIVLCVWLRKRIRSHTTILLSILAVSDSMTAVCTFMNSFASFLKNKELACSLYGWSLNVAIATHTFSVYLTTYLAVQKFVICAAPFKGSRYCKKTTSVIAITALFLFSVAFVLIFYGRTDVDTSYGADKSVQCSSEVLVGKQDQEIISNIRLYMRLFGIQILPMILTSISMSYCMYTLFHRKTVLSNNSRHHSTIKQSIVLVCAIEVIFILGELPTTIAFISLFAASIGLTVERWFFSTGGVLLANVTVVVSYFMNIWVYLVLCTDFRKELLLLLRYHRNEKPHPAICKH